MTCRQVPVMVLQQMQKLDEMVAPAVALAEGFEVRQRFLNSLGPEMVADLSTFAASAAHVT